MKFRRVIKEDLQLTYSWANDPSVRQNSYNSEKISLDEHKNWLFDKINDPDTLFLIGEENNESIGQLRFERFDNHAIIGITVAPSQRGKGYGAKILKEGLKEYSKLWKVPVHAFIKKDNIASIKAFEKAGFVFKEELNYRGHPSKLYVWK